jgi:cation diffusion facilitator CzcD-associated flavoprotein CzcO
MGASRQDSQTTVAIIGTGFGGLCMAIQLKKAGMDSFIIFEKANRVGGTWRENTYPGAACDVPSHLYSFSFEIKHDWSRKYAEQPEILGYLQHCAEKYGLLPHIRFNTMIEGADFDEKTGLWNIRSSKGETFSARVLISACGQLNRPAYPKLRGIDNFKGTQFHSAHWNHDYDFEGKRVAVVGTGASAIQFVPPVAKKALYLTLFQRTPPWIIPKPDRAYLSIEKTLFKYLPWIQALHRLQIYCWNESRFLAFRKNSLANKIIQAVAQRHLRRDIENSRLKKVLTPDYPAGCKRVLISNDYFETLARPNVSVVTDEIVEVKPDGIVTGAGDFHPADAIIYGTGFQATDFLAPMKLTGRGGRDLNEAWREGAEAYLGITVSGFPNLFILYGPNTNLAHNSIIYMLESQVQYVLCCLRTLLDKNLKFMDLKNDRFRIYNDEMQTRLKQSVWDAGCSSWYKTASGKNTNNWPGFTFEYRRRTCNLNLSDYELAAD